MSRPSQTNRRKARKGGLTVRSSLLGLAGGIALAGVMLTFGGKLYAHLGLDDPSSQPEIHTFAERFAPVVSTTVIAKTRVATRPVVAPAPDAKLGFGSLMNASYSLGAAPASFEQRITGAREIDVASLPPQSEAPAPSAKPSDSKPAEGMTLNVARELLVAVPLPQPRPQEAKLAERTAPKGPTAREIASASREVNEKADASIFEKLFGKVMPRGNVFAYAAPDGGVTSDGRDIVPTIAGRYDRQTAVYDISAKAVYMPDGTKLEAHSGLGEKMDDVRYVHVKMQGATPPHTYELTPRERLFHGVEALRMHPVGGAQAIHGRTGLLTHSYLLGPNGQSNGCISFRDYDKFLNAYKRGEVKRIVVVAKLD